MKTAEEWVVPVQDACTWRKLVGVIQQIQADALETAALRYDNQASLIEKHLETLPISAAGSVNHFRRTADEIRELKPEGRETVSSGDPG